MSCSVKCPGVGNLETRGNSLMRKRGVCIAFQKHAWGKDAMRRAIEHRFLKFSYVRSPLGRRLKDAWKNGELGAPPISICFANKHVATIENWSLDQVNRSATLHHFRVHDVAVGMKLGEALLRGFANALRSVHDVCTIYIWETHQHVPGYVPLFERLGARRTQIVSGGYQEWVWNI